MRTKNIVDIRTPTSRAASQPRRKIYDHRGREVGNVGPNAGLPTVSRFLGHRNATLKAINAQEAWVATQPPGVRSKPQVSTISPEKSRRADKGSVDKTLAEVSAMGATTAKIGGGG